jgi:hypothetical protein
MFMSRVYESIQQFIFLFYPNLVSEWKNKFILLALHYSLQVVLSCPEALNTGKMNAVFVGYPQKVMAPIESGWCESGATGVCVKQGCL